MTKEEKHLWYDFLKKIPYTVHRQKVIGRYVADFYCAEKKLIIELDGLQHGRQREHSLDCVRDQYFVENGFTVLRYQNSDIYLRFDDVCSDILHHLEQT